MMFKSIGVGKHAPMWRGYDENSDIDIKHSSMW